MAKRFTDSEKWKDEWFGSLPNDYRMIWLYLIDSCSIAGIWKKDFRGLNFNCNTKIDEAAFATIFKGRVIDRGNYFFILKFLKFQYPTGLNSNKPAVISVVNELRKHNLLSIVNESLGNDYLIIKDKDKDTDKDKNKDKDEPKKNEISFSSQLMDDAHFIDSIEILIHRKVTGGDMVHFCALLDSEEKRHTTYKEFKKHFRNWLFKKQENGTDKKNSSGLKPAGTAPRDSEKGFGKL